MMLIVETFFSDWLLKEMNARTWSQADLARAAGLSRTAVSNVLSQQRQPGPEFCIAIAHAFGFPPDVVFRVAGLLPPSQEQDEETQKMLHLFEQMTPEDQEMMIGMAQMFLDKRTKKSQARPAEA